MRADIIRRILQGFLLLLSESVAGPSRRRRFVVRIPTSARFRFSSYVLAEGGVLVFDPTRNNFGSVPGAQPQATRVRLQLRCRIFEYRGLVYPRLRHGGTQHEHCQTHGATVCGTCVPER